ncbi:MAG: hypothetical protein Q9168_003463 [Polycauliona sp. 1 TL-2023]
MNIQHVHTQGPAPSPTAPPRYIRHTAPTAPVESPHSSMHLMYTTDANGQRLYTLKKVAAGEVTKSAHPARFSPDDKYSRTPRAVLYVEALG